MARRGFLSLISHRSSRSLQRRKGSLLSKVQGGLAANAVPAHARAVIASDERARYDDIIELAKSYSKESGYDVTAKKTGTSLAVEAHGVAAHGSVPEKGLML